MQWLTCINQSQAKQQKIIYMQLNSVFKLMLLINLAALCGCATALKPKLSAPEKKPALMQKFVIYYGHSATREQLAGYDVLVFDGLSHPDLALLRPDQMALGYVSIGEAKPNDLGEESQHLVLDKHPVWKGDIVDVRHADWHDKILQHDVPNTVERGFAGLMLDTAEMPVYLEHKDPVKYKGMRDAIIRLIHAIRQSQPDTKIMLNRAAGIWPQVASSVDMILLESTMSGYDFETNEAALLSQPIRDEQMRQISTIREQYPHLKFYSVDYWNMNDSKGVKLIYQKQRKNGVVPYVTTPFLDAFHPEPKFRPWLSLQKQRALYGGSDA